MWTYKACVVIFIFCLCRIRLSAGCNFYPVGEYLRFVRIPENLQVGGEVLKVEVHPRKNLSLQPVDDSEDAHYFTYRDVNRTHVSVILAQTLETLVDADNPQNVLKFRMGCDFEEGEDMISAFLSVTVYVEDVNDHTPAFTNTPYEVTVDELTPVGLTIYKAIHAFDRDKPNTPNSDVQYSLVGGDIGGHFALDSSHKAALVLTKRLDYDQGDREFNLVVLATDRGNPPRSANTSVHILVQDNDDLSPRFTEDVYRTRILEFYPLQGQRIHKELLFESPIIAFDQDLGLDAPLRYDIISGNERHLFSLDPVNASLFLNKEIDLDAETTLSTNTFVLQIQASQIDNPLKTAQARVELEILDLNDNLPEFEVDFYNISIVENLPNGFSVLQVMASDKDQGDNGEYTYQLDDPNGAFSIDPRTGWLTVRDQNLLDRERHASLKMKVYAKEKNPSIVGANLQESRAAKWNGGPSFVTPHSIKDNTLYIFPDKTGMNNDNVEFYGEDHQLMSFVNVEVTLLDANDNNPVFLPSNLYEFTVKSNSKVGSFIGRVKAVDPDLGRNGIVLYDLQRTSNLTVTSPFQVDAQSGSIYVAESPLVEGRHALFIEASDQPANPSERRFTLSVVSIDVVKPNKGQAASVPAFIGAPYEFWVGASVGVGTSVGQIRLADAADELDVVYDLLHTYHEGVPFAVEERSGTITVLDNLSKFTRPMYDFEAIASLSSLSSGEDIENATISTNVTIHVVDVNDERGVLMRGVNSPIVFHVKENLGGAIIGQLLYNNSTLRIMNNSSNNIRFFIANQQDVTDDIAIGQDGTLFTQKPLDREKRDIYRVTIIAEYNKGLVSGAGIYQVTIHVDDDNDNSPIFKSDRYEGTIYENSESGAQVNMSQNIRAIDADLGNNAIIFYTLVEDGYELFEIDQVEGRVYFVGKKLDREERSTYNLRVIAQDKGNLSSETKLTINVLDVNDNTPVFIEIDVFTDEGIEFMENYEMKSNIKIYGNRKSNVTNINVKYELKPMHRYISATENLGPLFSLPETVSIGTCILQVEATDKDSGMNGLIKYELKSQTYIPSFAIAPGNLHMKHYFMINEGTGQLLVTRTLPPESEFRLVITAADGENNKANLSIRIFVKDVNDHIPMFKKSWYSFDVDEALYSRRVLGKVDAIDGDFKQNANITYSISSENEEVPFEISPLSGVFSINGELDRETRDSYNVKVIATDNGLDKKLSSTVNVEVHVTDVNDNAPRFYGFDEILEWEHPEAYEIPNHNFESVMILPVYRASLLENSPIGTEVTRVYANDTDFTGNGNGLLLFNIPQRKNQPNIFSIDSKDGIVTLTGKLDYEMQTVYNVTIVASDLGSPSLSSTAMLILSVIDVPEEFEISNKPVFVSRYYEVEIEENSPTPVELLTLNLTEYYEQSIMKYSIVADDKSDIRKMFVIDPRNGTLYLVRSPDRETRDTYEIIVSAQRQKISRNLPHMLYPISDEVLEGMSKFEVKIVIKIKDVNDNAPKFTTHGRPIVTAIPTTAAFGYQVIKLEATDIDLGVNADIRYQIINDAHGRFAIDPKTGDVRASASFAREGGRVFGFDVKATDKRGADDGKSAIANVFVYVLDERAQTVLALGARPAEVERALSAITHAVATATGYDVRVRKLEAHPDARNAHGTGARDAEVAKTDMYIYAVDPLSNAIIDTDTLQKSLMRKESELKRSLSAYKLVSMGAANASGGAPGAGTGGTASRSRSLSVLEAGVVALGCLVFVGALVTAVCVLCIRKSRRRRNKSYPQQRLNGMAFSTDHLPKLNTLFPSGGNQCQELSHSYGEADSYIDVLNSHSVKQICQHGNTIEEFGKAHQNCLKNQFAVGEMETQEPSVYNAQKHDKTCIKFNQISAVKRRSITGLETSMTSVHSSGQDSGIAEGRAVCACGHSNTQTSEESLNGSYEDSLKSQTRPIPYHLHHVDVAEDRTPAKSASKTRQEQLNDRRLNHIHESFADNSISPSRQIQNTRVAKRQINLKLQKDPRNIQNYTPKHIGRRPTAVVDEPTIDYDQSESEDVSRSNRIQRNNNRSYSNHNYRNRNSKLLELTGQAAVFVATPAAAAIMRRQGSERLVISRPIQ